MLQLHHCGHKEKRLLRVELAVISSTILFLTLFLGQSRIKKNHHILLCALYISESNCVLNSLSVRFETAIMGLGAITKHKSAVANDSSATAIEFVPNSAVYDVISMALTASVLLYI